MSAPASTSTPSTNGAAAASTSSSKGSSISSTDVGWQFVPQYYNFVNKHPQRLHCFYTKHSTFIHGTEGEDGTPSSGQQDIHQKILSIGFKDCKVFIHSVDSQPSANGGIIIQVIGEMSNDDGPWRKFVQTFFLAEQPNGYFVLNDIFRFLKEDTIGDDDETAPSETDAPATVDAPKEAAPEVAKPAEVAAPTPAPAPAAAAPAAEKKEAAPPAPEPTPAPVEEKKAAPVPEAKKETPAPVAETPVEEKTNDPKPEIESSLPVVDTTPAPTPAAEKPAAPAVAAPAPTPAAPKAAAPPAPAAPAAPTGPPVPKTWASLAKAAPGGWGNHLAPSAQGVSSAAKEAAAPAPAKEAAAPQEGAPANGRPAGGRHPAAEAALTVTTAQCFVKLANWAADRDAPVDTEALKSVLEARFGRVKELEIVKQKACAFLEFHTVDAARKAILASLPTQHGGEGGIKVQDGRVMVEVRKEKSERANTQSNQGPRLPRPQQGERTESGSGMTRGGGGGRGRGGEGRGGAGGGRGGPRGGRGGAGGAPAPKQ